MSDPPFIQWVATGIICEHHETRNHKQQDQYEVEGHIEVDRSETKQEKVYVEQLKNK